MLGILDIKIAHCGRRLTLRNVLRIDDAPSAVEPRLPAAEGEEFIIDKVKILCAFLRLQGGLEVCNGRGIGGLHLCIQSRYRRVNGVHSRLIGVVGAIRIGGVCKHLAVIGVALCERIARFKRCKVCIPLRIRVRLIIGALAACAHHGAQQPGQAEIVIDDDLVIDRARAFHTAAFVADIELEGDVIDAIGLRVVHIAADRVGGYSAIRALAHANAVQQEDIIICAARLRRIRAHACRQSAVDNRIENALRAILALGQVIIVARHHVEHADLIDICCVKIGRIAFDEDTVCMVGILLARRIGGFIVASRFIEVGIGGNHLRRIRENRACFIEDVIGKVKTDFRVIRHGAGDRNIDGVIRIDDGVGHSACGQAGRVRQGDELQLIHGVLMEHTGGIAPTAVEAVGEVGDAHGLPRGNVAAITVNAGGKAQPSFTEGLLIAKACDGNQQIEHGGHQGFFLRGELLKQVLESRLERCCVQRILKVHDGARDRSRRKAVNDASDKADDNGFRRCVIQGAVFAMIKEGEQLAEINIKQRIHDVIDERFRRQIRLNARAIGIAEHLFIIEPAPVSNGENSGVEFLPDIGRRDAILGDGKNAIRILHAPAQKSRKEVIERIIRSCGMIVEIKEIVEIIGADHLCAIEDCLVGIRNHDAVILFGDDCGDEFLHADHRDLAQRGVRRNRHMLDEFLHGGTRNVSGEIHGLHVGGVDRIAAERNDRFDQAADIIFHKLSLRFASVCRHPPGEKRLAGLKHFVDIVAQDRIELLCEALRGVEPARILSRFIRISRYDIIRIDEGCQIAALLRIGGDGILNDAFQAAIHQRNQELIQRAESNLFNGTVAVGRG